MRFGALILVSAVEDVDAEVRVRREHERGAGAARGVEDRLAALDRLKRKYGQTLAEVMAFGDEHPQPSHIRLAG